ncbi:MAG: TraM recognition domain-containing protein [Bdellovibrionota bacterium]
MNHFHLTKEQMFLLTATAMTVAGLGVSSPSAQAGIAAIWNRARSKFKRNDQTQSGITLGPLWISDEARCRHTHLVGATGTGKTCLLEQVIYQDIARGFGAVIIDPKGDRDFYLRIRRYCEKIGRASDLQLLSASYPKESVRWNPCRLGSASELQSKWFQSGVYSEPFYAKACENALLRAFNALIGELPHGFTPSDLTSMIGRFSDNEKSKDLAGLKYEISNLTHGEWGAILCANQSTETKKEVSILDIIRKQEILFVDLPTEARAVQSTRLGKLLLQEIMLISGLRKIMPSLRGPNPYSIYIDEFDAFASEAFVTLLNKGRSSGFMIHMAHQTLSDLDRVSQTFKGQILGNCSVRFIFRQDLPDDAETWARFLGTTETVKKTFQTKDGTNTGLSSNREVQEFIVSPDQIKSLRVGEFVFSEKLGGTQKVLSLPYPIQAPVQSKILQQRGETQIAPKPSNASDYKKILNMMSENVTKKESKT